MGGGGKDVPHDSAEGFGWRHDDVHGSQRQSPPPRAHPPKLPSSSNKPTKAQNISNQTKRNTSQTSPNSKLFYMAPKRVDPEQ